MLTRWKLGDKSSTALIWLVHLCLLLREPASATTKCATIEFPGANLEENIMPVPKTDNISIYFVFDNSDCTDSVKNRDITITIAKKASPIDKDVCKMTYTPNPQCLSFSRVCNCPVGGDPRSSVRKAWVEDDEAVWVWKVTGDLQNHFQERTIRIERRYPPEVVSLSLYDPKDRSQSRQTFRPGSSVDVVCDVSQGKPDTDVTPVLMKSNVTNEQLSLESGGGKWRRQISDLRCSDSGSVLCAAPGASQNRSELLLVACPPMIVNQVKNDKWAFLVTSHTKTFTGCYVTDHDGTHFDCLSHLQVSGTLPTSLLLTFDLPGVDRTANNWTLTLANEEGQGYFHHTPGQSTDASESSASTFSKPTPGHSSSVSGPSSSVLDPSKRFFGTSSNIFGRSGTVHTPTLNDSQQEQAGRNTLRFRPRKRKPSEGRRQVIDITEEERLLYQTQTAVGKFLLEEVLPGVKRIVDLQARKMELEIAQLEQK